MRCNAMAASYKKLFKLLIDRDMKKKELAEKAGISIATITKMGKDGAVISMDGQVAVAEGIDMEAVDPTGAGDTLAAALCVGLQEGKE